MKIVSVDEMRQIEQASDAAGWSYAAMMERAGKTVAEVVRESLAITESRPALVLIGPGNNGGDGLVAARCLHDAGLPVALYYWKRIDLKRCSEECAHNQRLIEGLQVHAYFTEDDPDLSQLIELVQNCGVVVDALLGTGVTRPIEGSLRDLLVATARVVSGRRVVVPPSVCALDGPSSAESVDSLHVSLPIVVAVDCPSGLNCDTGALDPVALRADVTVTFAQPKRGHFLFPGAAACGRLLIADIGTDSNLSQSVSLELATRQSVASILPSRPLGAHKGTFGKALLIVGSVSYTGAAHLSGAAATRVGTGLVTMAIPESLHAILASSLHEPTWLLLPEQTGVIAADATKLVRQTAPGYDSILLGCGLTREKAAAEFVGRLLDADLEHHPRIGFISRSGETHSSARPMPPMVIDADALNMVAQMPDWPSRLPPNSVLTPHPGEMARLCQCSTAAIAADRWAIALAKAKEWNQVVLLKGAFSLVAAPDGRATLLPFANPGLATAGSGDVLAGAIAGLLAQGLDGYDAALCAAYIHGLAGDLARSAVGQAGLIAGDLLMRLPEAMGLLARETA